MAQHPGGASAPYTLRTHLTRNRRSGQLEATYSGVFACCGASTASGTTAGMIQGAALEHSCEVAA
jgi:hypothetical protein